MNRTKIEWVINPDGSPGFTWNPIMGCTNNCPYCYARRQAARNLTGCELCRTFTPHLHEERLEQPLKRKKPATIFLGSMCDLWDPHVPLAWRERIWSIVYQTPQHAYLILTKQPQNLTHAECNRILWCRNIWLGISLDRRHKDLSHVERIGMLNSLACRQKFISFEPLLGPITLDTMGWLDWAIIGAQTGVGANQPEPTWVQTILDDADWVNLPVFMKHNLDWPEPKPREVPYLRRTDG